MPTTERAILTIILKIALVFFFFNLLQQAPQIITFIVMSVATLMAWTETSSAGGFSVLNYTFFIVSYVALLGFGLYAWKKPSALLGPLTPVAEEPDKTELDAHALFQGALALMGIYFTVLTIAALIRLAPMLIPAYQALFETPTRGSNGLLRPREILAVAAEVVTLCASVTLIFSRKTIANAIMNTRSMRKT